MSAVPFACRPMETAEPESWAAVQPMFPRSIGRFTRVRIEADGLIRPLVEFAGKAGETHLPTLYTGLGLLLLLRLLKWRLPRFPGPLAAIAAGVVTLLVVRFGVAGRYPWLDPTLSGLIAAAIGFAGVMLFTRR